MGLYAKISMLKRSMGRFFENKISNETYILILKFQKQVKHLE